MGVTGGRPLHRRPSVWVVVWLGGAAGTGARYLLSGAVGWPAQAPLAIAVINVVGAFLLGVLLPGLARRGSDEGRRRTLRLLLGTGFLGGFTTYSTLAVDTVTLLRDGLPGYATGYATATVLLGGLASYVGIRLGLARRATGGER